MPVAIIPARKGDGWQTPSFPKARGSLGKMVLRSSVHTLQKGVRRRRGSGPPEEGLAGLPDQVRVLSYVEIDLARYDLVGAVREILEEACDDLGIFRVSAGSTEKDLSLFWTDMNEDREKCLSKQARLTAAVAASPLLRTIYEALVREQLAPWLQRRLAVAGLQETRIYYQRPPTMRIHVSGTGATVRCHNDCAYGHQAGELNFWTPLTDCPTSLWVESAENRGDFKPLETKPGIIGVFHGSKCKHYVPENDSNLTRVSLDFRLAPASCFNPNWQLKGTIADHDRGFIDLPPYFASISNAVDSLLVHGYASMPLPTSVTESIRQAFDLFPPAEDFLNLTSQDMRNLNGYHSAGGMLGGFNKFREGCVFQSTQQEIWPMHQDNDQHLAFAKAMEVMRKEVHDFVARVVLRELASKLNLSDDFFLNEFDLLSESQFHLKRLTGLVQEGMIQSADEEFDALPAHVDPSLISLLVHNDNSGGLEVLSTGALDDTGQKAFLRLPHTGPHSCCLLLGSLLHILEPAAPTCKHRVRPRSADLDNRLAATFFFQPKSDTKLVPLAHLGNEAGQQDGHEYPDFSLWKQRAYGTYLKKKNNNRKALAV